MPPQEPIDPAASTESLAALLDKDDATNRLIARHPKAGAALLEKLSHSSDRTTRALVTANPDTPTAVYLRLGAQFPSEFLANPMLDLLFLEHPALLQELPDTLLVQVLRRPNCPQGFLVWAASHGGEKVQLAVAMNAKAPQQAVEQLGSSIHAAVVIAVSHERFTQVDADTAEPLFRQAVQDWLGSLSFEDAKTAWEKRDIGFAQLLYLSTPVRLRVAGMSQSQLGKVKSTDDDDDDADADSRYIALLEERSKDRNIPTRMHVAQEPMTPVTVLEVLALDQHYHVRSYVAKNPKCPVTLLEVLAMDQDASVRSHVAEHPNTPGAVLEVLAKDAAVLVNVARHPNTPVASLEELAKNIDVKVRSAVAGHPKTPVSVLHELAKDKDAGVRSVVADNSSTTTAVLEVLAKDKDQGIRQRVSMHPSAPVAVFEMLAMDEDSGVRKQVARNPKTPVGVLNELAKDKDSGVRECAALNPKIPTPVLHELARDKDSGVRDSVAAHPNTPVGVLETLAKDRDKQVRSVVAENPNTTPSVLEVLARDKDEEIRLRVAEHPNTTPSVLKVLAKDNDYRVRSFVAENSNTTPSVLKVLAKDEDEDIRLRVAEHHNTTTALLEVLARDKDSDVRRGVAKNPCTPEVVLERLAKNANWDVRCAVIGNPATSLALAEAVRNAILFGDLRQDPWFVDALNKADAATQAAVAEDNFLFFPVEDPDRRVLSTRTTAKLAALCSGPYVAPERIARVSGSTDWLIRAAVARNAGTPPNLLRKLTADGHPLVAGLAKLALSRANQSSPEISVVRAGLRVERIIAELASRLRESLFDWLRNAPVAMLELLAKHQDSSVRSYVAEHSGTPVSMLEVLAVDQCSAVRLSVAEHAQTPPAVLEVMAKENDSGIRSSIAKHPNTPVAVLEVLARDQDSSVRSFVAKNPKCPVTVLEILSKDQIPMVRNWVAKHPGIPVDLLERLAMDEILVVRRGVAGNRKTPVALREVLAKSDGYTTLASLAYIPRAIETDLDSGVASQLHDVATDFILRGVMLLRGLSRDAGYKELTAASHSTDWLMRLGAAMHPAATDAQLKLLSQDADADVASAAALSLSRLGAAIRVEPVPVQLATLVAPCPTCKGLVKEGAEGYSCVGPHDGQEGQGCGFAFKKTHAGRTFTVAEAEQLVRDGRIGPLTGFISKAGAPFAAQMLFNFNKTSQNYRLQFDFANDTKPDPQGVAVDLSNQTSLGPCPKCSGAVFAQEKDYVCTNSVASPMNLKPSCNFKTGRIVLQQAISPEQVGKLLSTGRTDLLDGFVSSRTQKKFTAMLVWDARAGKVGFEFTS